MSVAATIPETQTRSETLQQTFRALGEPNRFAIFDYLIQHGGICIQDAAESLNITTAAACQHLKVLQERGIVCSRRNGREVHYELNSANTLVCLLRQMLY